MDDMKKSMERADILVEALPYIRRFFNKTVVIKYGGHAMADEELKDNFARDVVLMKYIGINPVVVHGGGPQIGRLLKKLGKESKFVQGMRVTDVPGVLDRNEALIQAMDDRMTRQMIEEGTIAGGMFPKVKCCLKALRAGVKKAHIVDGRLKHTILLEMFTDQGTGTEIVL